MTASEFVAGVLAPSLAWFHTFVAPGIPASAQERVMLTAIAGQESDWSNVQQSNGPARGYWQIQENDCADILENPATSRYAKAACSALGIEPTGQAVYAALLNDPRVQATISRLNLWADPYSLPAVGDGSGSYAYYLAAWCPGRPSNARWNVVYPASLEAVTAA